MRAKLKHVTSAARSTHPGLWSDRYLTSVDPDDKDAKREHVQAVAGLGEPTLYKRFYERWQETLAAAGATCREAKVEGRMVVGVGGDSVWENHITLHRTYGVPVIPGSALKGLTARYARTRLAESGWGGASPAYQLLFGDTTAAGYITFFDALYAPGTGHEGQPLHPDVLTVHHPDYYRGEQKAAPADWDSPIPIPFLSATGKYLVAVAGPTPWVQATLGILKLALADEGIGAKTSSGYGRMTLGKEGA